MGARKVAVIGIDGITPVMVHRFLAEGRMPRLARRCGAGWCSEGIPTMPPTTPTGWTTIATGARPSTHGIEGFAVHTEGDPLEEKPHACTTTRVKAVFVWQAAERAEERAILLTYPMSWPPSGGDPVVQVDGPGGRGGLTCVWRCGARTQSPGACTVPRWEMSSSRWRRASRRGVRSARRQARGQGSVCAENTSPCASRPDSFGSSPASMTRRCRSRGPSGRRA